MLCFPIVQLRRKLRWQLMAVACGVAWILAANLSHYLAWAPTEVPIPNSLHQCLLQENQDTCQRQRASYLHWNSLQFQLLILTLFPSIGATGVSHGELSNHAWQWLKHESMNQLQFSLSPTALRPSTIAFLNPTNKRADRTILRNRCVGMRKKQKRTDRLQANHWGLVSARSCSCECQLCSDAMTHQERNYPAQQHSVPAHGSNRCDHGSFILAIFHLWRRNWKWSWNGSAVPAKSRRQSSW